MANIDDNDRIAQIREHAFNSLDWRNRELTNLYLDRKIYEKGEKRGPAFQKLIAPKRSVLVFADDNPLANYGHDCRYLLYDAETGEHHATLPARFPPYTGHKPETLQGFHVPVRVQANPDVFKVRPILRCPIIFPDGDRYAILYSGMSNMRHLNDLEFCYRMLVHRYGFNPKHIYVLNYDGSQNTQDGPAVSWPGDGSAYQIKVTGKGDRAGFQGAINDLKTKLKAHDLLFIHTNNHGDNFGSGSFLCEYPSFGLTYMASDFCADLGSLPHYRSLIVMMEQCNAGGFNAPLLAASTADQTSIASAAIATQSSWSSPDGNWDSFARDWIAAEIGHNPYGAALAFNPDTNGDGVIEAVEAFNYANAVKNPSDSPNFSQSSAAGGNITLGQHYLLAWWWCWILWPILHKYYVDGPVPYPGPGPEFDDRIRAITPELQKIMLPAIDRAAVDLRREVGARVEEIVKSALDRKSR